MNMKQELDMLKIENDALKRMNAQLLDIMKPLADTLQRVVDEMFETFQNTKTQQEDMKSADG